MGALMMSFCFLFSDVRLLSYCRAVFRLREMPHRAGALTLGAWQVASMAYALSKVASLKGIER